MNSSDIIFVTLGDSWTLGHGTQYVPGMSEDEFTQSLKITDQQDDLSFRGILSKKYNMLNINLSFVGSSNQRQFRLAKEFFTSTRFKKLQDEGKQFLVFWALTTTARNEFFLLDCGRYVNFRYNYLDTHHYKNHPLPKAFIAYSYDHLNEINLISQEISFWNSWFKMSGIKNLWADTFEHNPYYSMTFSQTHKETYMNIAGPGWPQWERFLKRDFANVSNEILEEISAEDTIFKDHVTNTQQVENFVLDHPTTRDLYSNLLRFNNQPVLDIPWKENTELVKMGILNPYTKHPTTLGQKQLAELINPYINQALSH